MEEASAEEEAEFRGWNLQAWREAVGRSVIKVKSAAAWAQGNHNIGDEKEMLPMEHIAPKFRERLFQGMRLFAKHTGPEPAYELLEALAKQVEDTAEELVIDKDIYTEVADHVRIVWRKMFTESSASTAHAGALFDGEDDPTVVLIQSHGYEKTFRIGARPAAGMTREQQVFTTWSVLMVSISFINMARDHYLTNIAAVVMESPTAVTFQRAASAAYDWVRYKIMEVTPSLSLVTILPEWAFLWYRDNVEDAIEQAQEALRDFANPDNYDDTTIYYAQIAFGIIGSAVAVKIANAMFARVFRRLLGAPIGGSVCAICNSSAEHECESCGSVAYCSMGCQRVGWDAGHKDACR